VFEDNPYTTNPWSVAEIDACQWGVRVQA
jgi:hypothetical protein